MEVKSSASNVIRDLPRTGISDKLDHALAGAVIFAVTAFAAHKIALQSKTTTHAIRFNCHPSLGSD